MNMSKEEKNVYAIYACLESMFTKVFLIIKEVVEYKI